MDTKNRRTGIDLIGEKPWGTHFCQFYRTKEDLLDTLLPYFRAGLENNEYCMWITSEPLGAEEAREAISAAIPGFDDYAARGQIEIIPHTDWYVKDGYFDSDRVLAGWVSRLEAALRKGFAGLRLTGNTFWLEKEDWKGFTEYERAVNNVIGKYPILALCTYSLEKCDLSDVVDVMANHRFALIRRAGDWSLIESSTLKQVETRLVEAESRYKTLFNRSPFGIIVIDPDTSLPVEFNDAICSQLGYSREEFAAKRIQDYESAETPAQVRSHMQKILEEGQSEFETAHRTKSGEIRDVFVTVKTIESDGKKYLYAIYRDITESKRQEVFLQESEKKYRSLFENMVDGAAYHRVVLDKNGKPADYVFLEVNRSFERMLGLKREDVIGRKVTEVIPGIESGQPDLIGIYGNVALTGEGREFDFYSEPLKKWFTASAYSPSIGFFVCVFSDITEKKTSEQAILFEKNKLTSILGAMNDGVYIVNRDYMIEYLNPVLTRRFGEYKGEKCYEYLHRSAAPCKWCPREKVFSGLTVHREWTDPDNGRTYDIMDTPLRNPDGGISKLELMHDITKRKRAEDMLLRSKIELEARVKDRTAELSDLNRSLQNEIEVRKTAEEKILSTLDDLEKSNKDLEQFAYVISHDLQEPLRMIGSYLQLLESSYKGKLGAEADEFIFYAVDGAHRMSAMVHDILTYSRVGTRGQPLEETDCGQVCGNALSNLAVAIGESGAEVRLGPLPRVNCDPSQLTSVFQNLVENAIKFRKPGTAPKIDISAERKGGEWVFSISDNGIGIERQFADRVFLIFQRLHGKDYPGTGIGLAVCKKIIERHGGRMWIESEPGVGSRFFFTLPAPKKAGKRDGGDAAA